MSFLILHNTRSSRTGLLVKRLMPIVGLHWKKIDEPALAGTPFDPDEGSCTEVVLQIGRRYFIGWVRIALELNLLAGGMALFPNGNDGMPIALSFWLDKILARESIRECDSGSAENNSLSEMAPHIGLVARQIRDGRLFLQGDQPSLADCISEAVVSQILQQGDSDGGIMQSPSNEVSSWLKRMQALGDGQWEPIAHQIAAIEAREDAFVIAPKRDASAGLGKSVVIEASTNATWRGDLSVLDVQDVTLRRKSSRKSADEVYLSFSPLFVDVRSA